MGRVEGPPGTGGWGEHGMRTRVPAPSAHPGTEWYEIPQHLPPPPSDRRRSPRRASARIAVLLVLVLALLAYAIQWLAPSSRAISGVASRVAPAVVDVSTSLADQEARLAGTGIVLTRGGLVLTNNHVIEGAGAVTVRDVGNGKTYTASVVGYDSTDDVAVLRLAGARGLATAPIGGSSGVRVGDQVLAMGNAGGAGGTPSTASGTVRALDQSIIASDEATGGNEELTGLIQTDAAVEPGDSGGPLIDGAGLVIGINTAASSGYSFRSGPRQSFAIPMDHALAVAGEIREGTESTTVHVGPTAFLGVTAISSSSAEVSPAGAVVTGVVPNSPAASAGLRPWDVIVAVGGHRIASPSALAQEMERDRPGQSVQVQWVDQFGESISGSSSSPRVRPSSTGTP